MAALKSDASIDLFTIDVGSSVTTKNWAGPINMVPANQSNGKSVAYANIPAGKPEELVTYRPFHMSVNGFEINGSNKLPQPKVTFSNMDASFTDLNKDFDDFVGFRLIRTRTYAKFLAEVDGIPVPTFSADAHFQPDIWMFNRKMEENNQYCVYELASIFDVEGIRYPRRRMYSNYCPFVFKGPDCLNTNSNFSKCGKTLAQCKERFGDDADLRFGGFPTAR
jgi:lambda family phage minor tail protein L|tara:strand:+ start:2222 stop:2887 length:666 start_codon:yes stop_codon:yes gene_type:complete